MKKASFVALIGAFVMAPALTLPQAAMAEPTVAEQGKMLYTSAGARLVPVYRVTANGSAQIIFEGKMVTIPVATLSDNAGRLVTSLSKNEILSLK